MVPVVQSNDELDVKIDDHRLEIFSLIWLDKNVNLQENRQIEGKLRAIINHIKNFEDDKQCQQYIEQSSQTDRLVLVVNGQMGRIIVPTIHHLRQVVSIYVYCIDKEKNKEWASQFGKVRFKWTISISFAEYG